MLASGTTLGPYQITAPLGSGGMGEVYRARDTRLARDVAIKVIHAEVARDRDRIRRFEQEARAASALSHENVCTVYDLGVHEGSPYVVMELLEGGSLRERLRSGALPVRKAIDYAAQAARGLAAAHAKGIVHRDLKPENLFVTKAGRVKVLDFGLAKLTRPDVAAPSGEAAISVAATETHAILGTVGYMSPEQVRGEPADARSDLFALGAILYELLRGRRAFHGSTSVETLNAILKAEPAPLIDGTRAIPPALELIVRRCLEKDRAERFQNASDLAFDLESLSGSTLSGRSVAPPALRRGRWIVPAAMLVALAAVAIGAYVAGRSVETPVVPPYDRLTFRRGGVDYARFTPDGKSVIYGATYIGEKPQLYMRHLATPDARPLGVSGLIVGVVGGEMAIIRSRALTVMPLDGTTPVSRVENVARADWSRDGKKFLVVRRVSPDSFQLECPPGKALMRGSMSQQADTPRLSPSGDRAAFVRLLSPGSDLRGEVVMLDMDGRERVLSRGWGEIDGLAWGPGGDEVWFTATKSNRPPALWAVTLDGEERLLAALPGVMLLRDVAPDGRALFTLATRRSELRGRAAADSAERDLSWLDATLTGHLSPDGLQMVFQEGGEGAGAGVIMPATYYRRMDGSPPVRLGDFAPYSVSPDWKQVLGLDVATNDSSTRGRLILVPIGAGEPRELPRGSIERYTWGTFFPTGDSVFIRANEPGGPERFFVQRLDGSLPRPLDHGIGVFSGDGCHHAMRPPGEKAPYMFYPLDGGDPRPIPFLRVEDEPFMASADGKSLFLMDGLNSSEVRITRLDLVTGARQGWLDLKPPDPVGVRGIEVVMMTPDGRYYTYCYQRRLSDLYVMKIPR